jgi:hypothetical protein
MRIAPGLIPRAWNAESPRRIATASGTTTAPDRRARRATYWEKATATAAVAPDSMMSSSDQPCRKATRGWNASRKKAYCPPTFGMTVLSSAKTKAPARAMMPPATQTARIRNDVPTFWATT